MGRFECDILRHMVLWGPHGALYDEDIYPGFGMTVQQFRRRFARIVLSLNESPVDEPHRNLLDEAKCYLEQHTEGTR
ncbi:hypothetical protein O6P37_11375 [Mycobacterium sp. CPCC 205372]|uniref:Uncharacterized protein n=1 Tax=Mycobacterium hippophais TaxID=3016340 RepID=A0ABT4PSC3_9MYCO|nr:hypothetical protein [Mycobacterium hippophais]MCZ8379466.1 hypothetical protein [Mycobacterium hippophais]